ncbi:MAG: NAD(P)-dependent oxidoreductase, partial [Roseobacter sp.]
MAKVAFLGLGVMGAPMAGHLQKAGHDVTVYNRTASKAEDWVKTYGGKMALTPAKAAEGADFVMSCVGNDDDLRSVCLGEDGAFAGMAAGSIFVDHTTVSAAVTRELYAAANDHQISFVDAPISGGQAGAENGALSIMCGGDEGAYTRALPVMEVYSKICRRIGESGAGQMTKMCNQIAIAGLVQGLSEALHFAEKAGLDGRAVVEVISQGAAGSWQMSNRYETMLDDHFDHGFATDWMRKDLGICLSTADETGASLPVTALVDQFYKDVQKMGGGRWDTSSLF